MKCRLAGTRPSRQRLKMKRAISDEELAKMSLPELIELAIEIMNDIELRLMEIAGEREGETDG